MSDLISKQVVLKELGNLPQLPMNGTKEFVLRLNQVTDLITNVPTMSQNNQPEPTAPLKPASDDDLKVYQAIADRYHNKTEQNHAIGWLIQGIDKQGSTDWHYTQDKGDFDYAQQLGLSIEPRYAKPQSPETELLQARITELETLVGEQSKEIRAFWLDSIQHMKHCIALIGRHYQAEDFAEIKELMTRAVARVDAQLLIESNSQEVDEDKKSKLCVAL